MGLHGEQLGGPVFALGLGDCGQVISRLKKDDNKVYKVNEGKLMSVLKPKSQFVRWPVIPKTDDHFFQGLFRSKTWT